MSDQANKPARGRPKTLQREHVLKIAIESYWTDGLTGVSIDEICRRAGVSKPGVYREFGNEDGLKHIALETYQSTILAPLADILTEDIPFDHALRKLTDFILVDHEAHGLPAGCLQVAASRSKQTLGKRTRKSADRFRDQTLASLEQWIDRAKSKEQLATKIPTSTAALYIDAQIETTMELQQKGVAQDELEHVFRLALSVFA